MREKPDHAPRLPGTIDSIARLQILLAELLHGIERPLPAFKSTITSAAGFAAACFQELFTRRHRLERNAGQFRRLDQLRLKKKSSIIRIASA